MFDAMFGAAIAGGGSSGGFTPTETQLTAMNSGITTTDVEQIETNKTNILNIQLQLSNLYIQSSEPTGTISDGAVWINTSSNALSDYIKKYHECNNLFNTFDISGQVPAISTGELVASGSGGCTSFIPIREGNVTISGIKDSTAQIYLFLYDVNQAYISAAGSGSGSGYFEIKSNSITGYENARYTRVRTDNIAENTHDIMLNYGSAALPYEQYTTQVWHSNNT